MHAHSTSCASKNFCERIVFKYVAKVRADQYTAMPGSTNGGHLESSSYCRDAWGWWTHRSGWPVTAAVLLALGTMARNSMTPILYWERPKASSPCAATKGSHRVLHCGAYLPLLC
jgi:hypothetical protein